MTTINAVGTPGSTARQPNGSVSRARHPASSRFDEQAIILRFFRCLSLDEDQCVLDVGCGRGRKIRWLLDEGLRAAGVDINPRLMKEARSDGLDCVTASEFERSTVMYDAMLMAHIIEHLPPDELLVFIDGYLDRLRPGGHLIISTPVMWPRFYNDFDHIRPYNPRAIITVFSDHDSQVQYHSRNRLQLLDLGLRRSPISRSFYNQDYYARHGTLLERAAIRTIGLCQEGAFRMTGGLIGGQTTGWVGLFRKC